MSRTTSRSLRLFSAAAFTLVLVSCSNDSATPDATEAPTTTATATTEAPTTAAPTTEAPTTDAPTTEVATTDAPTTEAPTTEAPTTEAPALGSLLDVAEQAGNYTTLLAAIDAAGLTETLSEGQFTLLAPTDEAFAALGQDAIDALLADPAQLATVLRNHVLPSPQDAELISIMTNLVTIDSASLDVAIDGDTVTIGGATVVEADLAADNGVLHGIDAVLVPSAPAA